MGIYRYVHQTDSDHHLYHHDGFDDEATHYHAQFKTSIDEIKLNAILELMEEHTVITSEEHAGFINAYHEANTLPAGDSRLVESVAASKKLSMKDDEPSFAGFKRGFLLSLQEVSPKPVESRVPPLKTKLKEKASDDVPTFAGLRRGFFLTPTKRESKGLEETSRMARKTYPN
jgi:hypothetical protein